jgi:hypothetical protein
MTREIKFRAWDEINERWLEISSLQISLGKVNAVWELAEENELYGLHQVRLSQYTGLKDKNGEEIYEGDIINSGGRTEEVRWSEDGNGLSRDEELAPPVGFWLFQGSWGHPLSRRHELTVIGNIYENPELL